MTRKSKTHVTNEIADRVRRCRLQTQMVRNDLIMKRKCLEDNTFHNAELSVSRWLLGTERASSGKWATVALHSLHTAIEASNSLIATFRVMRIHTTCRIGQINSESQLAHATVTALVTIKQDNHVRRASKG